MARQRVVINEHLEIGWIFEHGVKQVRTFIDNKPFLSCSFLLVSVPQNDPANEQITIEELAERPGATALEGQQAIGFADDEGNKLTEDDVLWGFASSLQGWVDNDYNTQCLHANLSFPLLKELARAGDVKAKRVLRGEIRDRLKNGHRGTMIHILDSCSDIMDEEDWDILVKQWGDVLVKDHLEEFLQCNDLPHWVLKKFYTKHACDKDIPRELINDLKLAYIKAAGTSIAEILSLKDDAEFEIRKDVIFQLGYLLATDASKHLFTAREKEEYETHLKHVMLDEKSDEKEREYATKWCTDPDVLKKGRIRGVISNVKRNEEERATAIKWCTDPDVLDAVLPLALAHPNEILLNEVAYNRYLSEKSMRRIIDAYPFSRILFPSLNISQGGKMEVLRRLASNSSASIVIQRLLADMNLDEVTQALRLRNSLAVPQAKEVIHFKRLFVVMNDVNRFGNAYSLTVEEEPFHQFARRELLMQFLKRMGLKVTMHSRGIGHRRSTFRVEGTFKQVEVAWSSKKFAQHAFKFGYQPMRYCVPLISRLSYMYNAGNVERGQRSAMTRAIFKRGTVIFNSPKLANSLSKAENIPKEYRLWKTNEEMAYDPPQTIQRIYHWE